MSMAGKIPSRRPVALPRNKLTSKGAEVRITSPAEFSDIIRSCAWNQRYNTCAFGVGQRRG